MKKILILPKFYTEHRNKRGIFSALISGFIGLAFESISSFLHHKRHKALQKAVKAMSISSHAQRNKLVHLENSLIIYRVYNVETLEKSLFENLFAGQTASAYEIYSQMQNSCSVQHYVMNALLYLCTIKEKYIACL